MQGWCSDFRASRIKQDLSIYYGFPIQLHYSHILMIINFGKHNLLSDQWRACVCMHTCGFIFFPFYFYNLKLKGIECQLSFEAKLFVK